MASNQNRKRTTAVTGPESGESGVQIFNGVITGEEYNYKLTGRSAIAIWDEMRRSDATVGSSLRAIKLPIKSAKWFITSASEDDLDIQIRDFVDWNMFTRLKWKTILGEILTHLEFGFSVHEMVFGVEEVDGLLRVVLTKIGFRKQTTITSWEAGKGIPGVTQSLGDGTTRLIPLNKLIVFTNEQEGDNYEGRSILRAAYKHWYYKDKLYQIDAVGAERQALGVVEIIYPKGANDKAKNDAKAVAMNLRANESAYVDHAEDWTMQFMDMKAGSLKDMEPSINHHDRQISKNVLAQFLEIGAQGSSGTRSTSEDHSKLFDQAGDSVAEYIANIMGYAIKTLVDLNFNVTDYPKMEVGKIGEENLKDLAETVSKFEASGLLTISDEDEAHVRNLISFPEKSDDVERTPKKKEEAKNQDDADDIKDDDLKASVAQATKLHASITEHLYGDKTRST